MTRAELVSMYGELHEQAREKTAEWYVSGHAWGLLSGSGEPTWVIGEIEQAQAASIRLAVEHGDWSDTDYGTYRVYMQTKADLYENILIALRSLDLPPCCAGASTLSGGGTERSSADVV